MTNVWYVKNILANCDGNMYLPILHLPRVELHCKLHEKLHSVTGPLIYVPLKFQFFLQILYSMIYQVDSAQFSSPLLQHNPLVINLLCFYMGQIFNENITVKRCAGTKELLVQMTESSNACFVSKKTQAANNGTA